MVATICPMILAVPMARVPSILNAAGAADRATCWKELMRYGINRRDTEKRIEDE